MSVDAYKYTFETNMFDDAPDNANICIAKLSYGSKTLDEGGLGAAHALRAVEYGRRGWITQDEARRGDFDGEDERSSVYGTCIKVCDGLAALTGTARVISKRFGDPRPLPVEHAFADVFQGDRELGLMDLEASRLVKDPAAGGRALIPDLTRAMVGDALDEGYERAYAVSDEGTIRIYKYIGFVLSKLTEPRAFEQYTDDKNPTGLNMPIEIDVASSKEKMDRWANKAVTRVSESPDRNRRYYRSVESDTYAKVA